MQKLFYLICLFFSLTSISYASNEPSKLSIKNKLFTLKIQGNNTQNNILGQNLFISQINLVDGTKISSFRTQSYMADFKQSTTFRETMTCFFSCNSPSSVQTKHLNPYYNTTIIPKTFQTGYAFTVKKVVGNQIYFQLVIRELLKMHKLTNSSDTLEAPELYKITLNDVVSSKDNSWHYVYKPQTANKTIDQQQFKISISTD